MKIKLLLLLATATAGVFASIAVAYPQTGKGNPHDATTTGGTTTTTYLNDPTSGAASEVVGSGSTASWHDFITAGGSIVAERFCTGAPPCSSGATLRYFVADHLGSTSALTDQSGTVTERLSYDAWGRRRNPNGTDDTTCSITSATTRGFTAQEHIAALCAVNFNARVYDPTLGRFTSPDPFVPDPLRSQSFNRFSYVENMPLSMIDPSGYIETVVVTGERTPQQQPQQSTDAPPVIGGGNVGGFPSPKSKVAIETVVITAERISRDQGPMAIAGFSLNFSLRFGSGGTSSPTKKGDNTACHSNDKQIVPKAVLDALSRLNPTQNENQNISPDTNNFAKVSNPAAIDTSKWYQSPSVHGSAMESPPIPGNTGFDVKMYNDPQLGNVIAVVYPTASFEHLILVIPYLLGQPVNADIARDYFNCSKKSG